MKKIFSNPVSKGADPSVTFHDGYYYFLRSEFYDVGDSGTRESLLVSKAKNLYEIGTAPAVTVYKPDPGHPWSKELWSPKLYFLDGVWYLYHAADDGQNKNHRDYVLRAKTDDPQGEYEMIGKICDPATDKWAIGPHILEYKGKRYFMWTGWEGDENVEQHLYIAEMENPWSLKPGKGRVSFCRPTEEWEKHGSGNGYPTVVEGATALIGPKGKVHVIYSASGCWTDDYCLGMLTLKPDADPLVAENWVKHPEPVFRKTDKVFGPGHAFFTTSPDGKEDWMVYHATLHAGDNWGKRCIFCQRFTWDENDDPVFGEPKLQEEWNYE